METNEAYEQRIAELRARITELEKQVSDLDYWRNAWKWLFILAAVPIAIRFWFNIGTGRGSGL